MPNVMFHVPDPEKVQRLVELAAEEVDAEQVPIHIKEDYKPNAYCGILLTNSDHWEFNQTWTLVTCQLCIQEDSRRVQAYRVP